MDIHLHTFTYTYTHLHTPMYTCNPGHITREITFSVLLLGIKLSTLCILDKHSNTDIHA